MVIYVFHPFIDHVQSYNVFQEEMRDGGGRRFFFCCATILDVDIERIRGRRGYRGGVLRKRPTPSQRPISPHPILALAPQHSDLPKKSLAPHLLRSDTIRRRLYLFAIRGGAPICGGALKIFTHPTPLKILSPHLTRGRVGERLIDRQIERKHYQKNNFESIVCGVKNRGFRTQCAFIYITSAPRSDRCSASQLSYCMDGRETTICRVRSVPDKDLEDDFEEKGGANACRQKFQSLSEFYCCLIFEVNYINFTSPSKCIVFVKYMQSIFFFPSTKDSHSLNTLLWHHAYTFVSQTDYNMSTICKHVDKQFCRRCVRC